MKLCHHCAVRGGGGFFTSGGAAAAGVAKSSKLAIARAKIDRGFERPANKRLKFIVMTFLLRGEQPAPPF
jgi:hypothetical protein